MTTKPREPEVTQDDLAELNHRCHKRLNILLKRTSWSELDQGDIRWCLHVVLTSAGYLEQEDM